MPEPKETSENLAELAPSAKPTEEAPTETAEKPAGAGTPSSTAEAERKYTQKELDERLSTATGGQAGTVKEMKKQMAALRKELSEAKTSGETQALLGTIQALEASGQADQARILRDVVEQKRQAAQARLDYEQKLELVKEQEAILNEAGKSKAAYDLAKSYGLGDADVQVLLKEDTPEKMEVAALKIARERDKAAARQPEQPGQGKGDVKGIDVSKLSTQRRFGLIWDGKLK